MEHRDDRIHKHVEVRVVSHRSTLGEFVVRPPERVTAMCSLEAAVRQMEQAGVSSLLVDGDGIVTERDIARALGHGMANEAPVEAVATWHPLVVPSSMTVVDACATMLNEQLRHLVIETATGERLVVSLRDVAAVLLQSADPQLWLSSLRSAIDPPAETWLG